jgi:heterodisulfide reductase subunit A-like polyferredoxin
MDTKIGVYICHCGANIAGTVDVEQVAEAASHFTGVAVARHYLYMCSDPGQGLIKEDIKELGLNRVVVASCSPRMHEITFRRTCEKAGLNPYLFEMANIREHCSWVHDDMSLATAKAKALVKAAVRRVSYDVPLTIKEVPVNPNTLIVGAGIAGIQAALKIGDSQHKVYLVEREPSIGGHMAQLDKTFPTMDCSACILTPKMSMIGSHPFIDLMTYSEVENVSGYIGNFKVKIKKKPRYVDLKTCTGCRECMITELGKDGLKESQGETWVDRLKINEQKCIQCGDCVRACVEENKNNTAMTSVALERRKLLEALPEKKSPQEILMHEVSRMDESARRDFWQKEFKKCIKCYACREVCPLCLCDHCEMEDPQWVVSGLLPPDYLFHLIRAYHIAPTCTGCGACEDICPVGIPLLTMMQLGRLDPEKIFDYLPVLDEQTKSKLIIKTKQYPVAGRGVRL